MSITTPVPPTRAAHAAGPALARAIDASLADGQLGLQIAVYSHGELVIDTAAGLDRAGGAPVDSSTVFFAASSGKASTATLLHRLVARGLLGYEQPIASLWPEFGAQGKAGFTVRDALTHRVGLAELPMSELGGDWDDVAARLAAATPSAEPALRDAYHAFTWGYLVGEIARRADPAHRPFLDLIHDEVHAPLGITELWHALPASEHTRTATITGDILRDDPFDFIITEDHHFNSAAHREHLDPSGAWMTARAGARLWALYAGGGALDDVRLLAPETVRSFLEPRPTPHGCGLLVGGKGVMGQGGLMLGGGIPDHAEVLGFDAHVLWHPGAGGTVGFADLDAGIAGMICHNQLFDERPMREHPFAPIVRAIYADLRA